jgi:cell division protein FtsB
VRVRLLAAGALIVLAAALALYGVNGSVRVWQMKREVQGLERDIVTLRTRTDTLARTVDRLRHDPAYIEKLAREDLGLVREGDTVLKFPPAGR